MNSRQYSLLFVVAFLGFASAQIDVPHATANMSSNSDQVTQGQTYQASCDYTVHKPTNSDGQQSEWELTVAFHKETMGMHDNWPVIAEYKRKCRYKKLMLRKMILTYHCFSFREWHRSDGLPH